MTGLETNQTNLIEEVARFQLTDDNFQSEVNLDLQMQSSKVAFNFPLKMIIAKAPEPRDAQLTSHAVAPALPPEILLSIFNRAIPPLYLLDSSLFPGPKSMWCKTIRTKKAIIGVCRPWYLAGISFLYEDISIRRLPQLFYLLRTLTNCVSFRDLVRTLDVHCFIPIALHQDFHVGLQALLQVCPRLSSLGFFSRRGIPIPTLHILPPNSITHLHLNLTMDYEALIDVLSDVQLTLLHLQLYFLHMVPELSASGSQSLSLPVLETLILTITEHLIPHLAILQETWSMPSLHRFTLANLISCNWSDMEANVALLAFLSKHGRLLAFLHLTPDTTLKFKRHEFRLMLQHCPQLEHLIISEEIFKIPKNDGEDCSVAHSKLRWLDVWEPWQTAVNGVNRHQYPLDLLKKMLFPNLAGVRRLASLPPTLYNWLAEFQPDSVSGNTESFAIDTFQCQLEHRVGRVCWTQPRWVSGQSQQGATWRYSSASSSSEEPEDESSGLDSDDENSIVVEDDGLPFANSSPPFADDSDALPFMDDGLPFADSSVSLAEFASILSSDGEYDYSSVEDIDTSDDSASELGSEADVGKRDDAPMDLAPELIRAILDGLDL